MDISEASPEKKLRLDFEDLHTSEPVEISEGEKNEKSDYFFETYQKIFKK